MLAGNPSYFSFWYEVLERTDSFCYGPFNIFVNGRILIDKSEDNFTLNIIASDLRRSIVRMDFLDEISPHFVAEEVFERAMHTHGYHTYSDPIFPESWWKQKQGKISELIDLFIEIEQERRSDPPFGAEISMYTELSDKGWRFFLFSCKENDILLFSNDLGKTVQISELPKGSVRNAVEEFLILENK